MSTRQRLLKIVFVFVLVILIYVCAINLRRAGGQIWTSATYDTALAYYGSLGYTKCDKLSGPQMQNHFWLRLRGPREDSCNDVFSEFTRYYNTNVIWPPPRYIPGKMKNEFLMMGHVRLSSWYKAERFDGSPQPRNWSTSRVDHFIEKAKDRKYFDYGSDTDHIYRSLMDFNLTDQIGLVIGSIDPWLEAILIGVAQVRKIVTIEYHPIISSHPQIEYVHPINVSREWKKYAAQSFDFAFTFSSLEHSGLGRYGDRLDPFGDLKEMQKLGCLVRPEGLVFLGVPFGADEIQWNAHRIYGMWRLPLMTANFELLGMYVQEKIENPVEWLTYNHYVQAVLVMKNRKNDSC